MQNMPARARKAAMAARPAGDSGHVGPQATPAPTTASRDVKAGVQIVRPSESSVYGTCNIRLQRLDVFMQLSRAPIGLQSSE